ncbi:MAG TPA: tetratricopeptide repeat protein, partial [Acidobacteriaceae bacterium]|nr:tetratricopeptide repeat protein [Acidobacteriaceae bacterium]
VPQLEAAVAANSKCAECHAMLGRALAATGKVAEGVHELEQAVTLAPNDPKAHYQLARLYRQAGDKAHAKEQFALSAKLYGSKSQGGSVR